MKNDNETLADCGGGCRPCILKDYIDAYTTLFIIIIVILGIIPLIFVSYIFFLLANPERARGLYDSNASFAFLIAANRFFAKIRVLRKKKPVISEDTAKLFIGELTDLGKKVDGNKLLHDEIVKIYTALISLPEEFDTSIFNLRLRNSNIPLFLKILFAGYYKKAEILIITSFVSVEEKADLVLELKFLLSEASKG
jgi:hypothetical protein